MRFNQDLLAQINWVPVSNVGDDPIPPFAALRVVGVDGEGYLQVIRPDEDSLVEVCFAGPVSIPPGKYGQATRDLPARVLFDASLGQPPFAQEVWGTKADTWSLSPGKDGFQVMGAVDPANNSVVVTGRGHSLTKLIQVVSLQKTGLYYPAVLYVFDTLAEVGVTGGDCWFLDLSEL